LYCIVYKDNDEYAYLILSLIGCNRLVTSGPVAVRSHWSGVFNLLKFARIAKKKKVCNCLAN